MDGLAIVTGISMLVFLLFYLAHQLNEENKFLLIAKFFLILFGLFLLSYIPSTVQSLDRDCAIISNGSYICYLSNGTYVALYGNATSQIGSGLTITYMNFLYAIVVYAIFLLFGWLSILIYKWFKERKYLK